MPVEAGPNVYLPVEHGTIEHKTMPATGTTGDWNMVVDANECWWILCMYARCTNADAVARRPSILLRDEINHNIFYHRAATLQPAGAVWDWCFYPGCADYERLVVDPAGVADIYVRTMPPAFLPANSKILSIMGGGALLQWGQVTFTIQVWKQ